MERLIKRYENRKLYDTEVSSYVSLSDVADLVRGGETVRIEDNVSGKDLTAQTLMQIILEEGKSGQHVLPSDVLHDLLRQSQRALDHRFDQIRHTVDTWVEQSVSQLGRLVRSSRTDELQELRTQLIQLETQLADLLEKIEERRASANGSTDDP